MPPLQQIRTALQYQTYKQQFICPFLWLSIGTEKGNRTTLLGFDRIIFVKTQKGRFVGLGRTLGTGGAFPEASTALFRVMDSAASE